MTVRDARGRFVKMSTENPGAGVAMKTIYSYTIPNEMFLDFWGHIECHAAFAKKPMYARWGSETRGYAPGSFSERVRVPLLVRAWLWLKQDFLLQRGVVMRSR